MDPKGFPVIPSDRADDLHHLGVAENADLVLFMAGNQFMVIKELIGAFQRRHPEIKRIFCETLPPGLELQQILAGGAVFRGRRLSVYPDIYTSVNRKAMETLAEAGHIRSGNYRPYLHNRLTLMVPRGNPAGVQKVSDLGGDTVRISQPDPRYEDIAHHIMDMYRAAGGEELVRRIMIEKRAEGTTLYTIVHHRETPLRIAERTVDAAPVWVTEAVHARANGLAFEEIDPGKSLDQRQNVVYYACRLERAPHPQNAGKFQDFLESKTVRDIYRSHGFLPHET